MSLEEVCVVSRWKLRLWVPATNGNEIEHMVQHDIILYNTAMDLPFYLALLDFCQRHHSH